MLDSKNVIDEITLKYVHQDLIDDKWIIGTSNGLVESGYKPWSD